MYYVLALLTTAFLALTCGRHTTRYERVYAHSCSVVEESYGARIECTDGTSTIVRHGQNGSDGSDAESCSVTAHTSGSILTCPDGTTATILHGESVTGPVGPAGTNCTVAPVNEGALIACEDGTTTIVSHGSDGQPGQDGADGQDAFVETIDPCGDGPGFDEVILRTSDGQLIAYFEDGGKRFLTELVPGRYLTTDRQRCAFEVTEEGEITW